MFKLADDQQTQQAEETVQEAEQSAEKAEEAAEEAKESATEAKEAAESSKSVAQSDSGSENTDTQTNRDTETPKSKPVSASLEKIIEQIEKLSVLELADLVHALEDRFGVSASAPVAVAAGASPAAGGEPAEEKTTFNVILSSSGANKIAVIKAVRELVPTLGLKEAKDLVEAAPKPVLESVNKTTAEEAKTKLTAAGATVELQ